MDVVKGAGQLSETDCIEINPEVLLRQPVIRGTWIPAEMILRKLSEKVLEAEPGERYSLRLTREGIKRLWATARTPSFVRHVRGSCAQSDVERGVAVRRHQPGPRNLIVPSSWNSRSDRGRRSWEHSVQRSGPVSV
jgi:uncharacterized protein (DUF433 family)